MIGSESEGEKEEQMISADPVAGIAIGIGTWANMANIMCDPWYRLSYKDLTPKSRHYSSPPYIDM